MPKYELTDETMEFEGRTLYRIRALCDISKEVAKGDLGGWVETPANLSQEGSCWIYHEGKALDNSRITDDAQIWNDGLIRDSGYMSDRSILYNNAVLSECASIANRAQVYGNAIVKGRARISINARINENAVVSENAIVSHTALVTGNAFIHGCACISSSIFDGEVDIASTRHFMSVENIGSEAGVLILYRTKDHGIWIKRGCFQGTEEEFFAASKAKHGGDEFGILYAKIIPLLRDEILR